MTSTTPDAGRPAHTPGPWRAKRGDSFDHGDNGAENGFEILLGGARPSKTGRCRVIDRIRYAEDIFPEDQDYAEAEANAHLIGGADRLYAALQELVEIYADEDCPDEDQPKCIRRAIAALAKARGEG